MQPSSAHGSEFTALSSMVWHNQLLSLAGEGA
jgi:hypothetical protein